MRIPFLLLLVFGFFSTGLVAQISSIDDCVSAVAQWEQRSQNEKEAIVAFTKLAGFYADEACAVHDWQKAYDAVAAAYARYRKLDRKAKDRLEGKDFAGRDLSRLRQQITQHFLAQAKAQGQIEAIDHFLEQYPLSRRSLITKAERFRDSLSLVLIQQSSSLADFDEIEAQYGSRFRAKSDLRQALDRAELQAWLREEGFDRQVEMRMRFPNNAISQDESIRIYKDVLEKDQEGYYRQFVNKYPNSPLRTAATDSLRTKQNRRVRQERARDSLLQILQTESASAQWKSADQGLASLMSDPVLAMRSTATLQHVPPARIPLSVARIYHPYRKVQTLEAIQIFQTRFPFYAAVPQLVADQKRLYRLAQLALQRQLDSLFLRLRQSPSFDEIERNVSSIHDLIGQQQDSSQYHSHQRWQRLDAWMLKKQADKRVADRYLVHRYMLLSEPDRYALEDQIATTAPSDYPLLKWQIFRRYKSLEDVDSLQYCLTRFANDDLTAKGGQEIERLLAAQTESLAALQKQLRPLLQEKRWAEALTAARESEAQFSKNVYYAELLDILQREEAPFEPKLMGDPSVNTRADEYTPVLSVDGQVLYFCRNTNLEVVHRAVRQGDQWVDEGPIEDLRVNGLNVAPLSITVDGNRLLIFRDGKMFYTDRTQTGWSKMMRYPQAINGGSWQGMASLTPDGSAMIFEARRRAGMQGNAFQDIDLYISFRQEDGSWQEAIRMGDIINTERRERSPYLHPDTRSLYFSTDGRSGLGGLDVYKTTRLDDTWLNWSEPVHLGKNANTPGDDWGYKITIDGRYAYFAADPDGDTFDDIYWIEIPPEARPKPVTLFTAYLLDNDQQPIEADLAIEDLEKGEVVARLRSEPGTGKVTATLPNERQYGLVFEDGKRLPFADNLDLRSVDSNQVVSTKIIMQTLEEAVASGQKIKLNNVFFDHDKSSLRSSSLRELERIAEIVQRNPQFHLQVNGHTDNSGSPEYNLHLSRKRAQAVRYQLIELGVPAQQISAEGFGETQAVVPNNSETNKAKNRRVEIQFRQQ